MPEADRLDVHALQFACTSGLALRPCSSCRQGLGVDENFVSYHFVDRPASCRLHLHRGPPWASLTSVGRPFKTSGVVLGRLWAQRKSRGESRKICRYGCASDKRSCLGGTSDKGPCGSESGRGSMRVSARGVCSMFGRCDYGKFLPNSLLRTKQAICFQIRNRNLNADGI